MSQHKIILSIWYILLFPSYVRCYFKTCDFGNVESAAFRVISTKILGYGNTDEINKKIMKSSIYLTLHLEETLTRTIFLKSKHPDVLNLGAQIRVYDKRNEISENIETKTILVDGYITSEPNSSYVGGYIESLCFYGKLRSFDKIYYLDNLKRYPSLYLVNNGSDKNAVVFQNWLAEETNTTSRQNTDFLTSDENFHHGKRYTEDHKLFKMIIGKGKVCTLFVIIDNSFLSQFHNNDMDAAIKDVLFSIEEANSLFRSTDFDNDGYPDNIGLMIKYFILLQSENSPMNLLPKYSEEAIDVRYYLKMFSRYSLLSEVCLGVAFTGQTFKNDIIGVSYSAVPVNRNYFQLSLGGICDRPFMNQPTINLNTLVVSAASEKGKPVPQYIFQLSLSHELGHSFGSDHDKTRECEGYLMTDHTPENFDRKHFVFSPCSKRTILETIVTKGHCFEEYDDNYCGNGRIEPGEECDCGTTKDCEEYDACCASREATTPCHIRRDKGYQCHPSQGLCCSFKCMYKDLSKYNLNCKNFQNGCPCRNGTKMCSCGIRGSCTDGSCSSEECTRLNLKECVCPKYLEKNSCQTCCLLNGTCLYSSALSKQLIERDESLVSKIKMMIPEVKPRRFEFYEEICNKNKCVNITFRKATTDEYCLLFGQLGICDQNYECILPDLKLIYPTVPVQKMKRSGITSNLNNRIELFLQFTGYYLLFCYNKIML